ncbi:hypothetical protein H4582DRAFT_2100110 [Lactarius indigo]|nr:hypothetical protein H4582DRAFT_2100110 [Lactarius indigo]
MQIAHSNAGGAQQALLEHKHERLRQLVLRFGAASARTMRTALESGARRIPQHPVVLELSFARLRTPLDMLLAEGDGGWLLEKATHRASWVPSSRAGSFCVDDERILSPSAPLCHVHHRPEAFRRLPCCRDLTPAPRTLIFEAFSFSAKDVINAPRKRDFMLIVRSLTLRILIRLARGHRSATTISTLPDNVLVEIFSLCRADEVVHPTPPVGNSPWCPPWKWQRLAHVCRTWRHVMFASSRRLCLELLCTPRSLVKRKLGNLPTFPIFISYWNHYYDLQRRDQDNLLAALENRDRVRVVDLGVPHTVFERLATTMQEPFPALTHLRLALTDRTFENMLSALPDTFLGGFAPRLQTIHISGIPFPAAPTLLLSAHDLVELGLCDIPPAGYIPPEAIAANLGTLPKLEYFTFEFKSGMTYPDRMHPILTTRNILPALTRFHFKGLFKYFEDFVARIDAPRLDDLRIECLELEITDFQGPQLSKFLNRSENFKLSQFIQADIFLMPDDVIAIELYYRSRSSLFFSVPQEAIGQVASHFSAMLSNVGRLFITADFEDTCIHVPWLALFRPFTSVKALSIQDTASWEVHLALNDVTGDGVAEVLPALEFLCPKDEPAESIEEFAREFVDARQNVGRPVTVVNEDEFDKRLKILDASE